MADGFESGDVVILKSGGPSMTVESLALFNRIPSAHCVWFDGSKQTRGVFAVAMLRKDEGPVI